MKDDQRKLLMINANKSLRAIRLVQSSLKSVKPFNPELEYSPKDLEPYDALSDRFIRAVEISLNFFRSYEYYMFAENSETLRDQLNRLEKSNIITSAYKWMQMRDIRNRIVHDYLPEEIKNIYDSIIDDFGPELDYLEKQINQVLRKETESEDSGDK